MEIKKLKGLLGMDSQDHSKDSVLRFIAEEAEEAVKNYCNINEIPSGLQNTVYHIAIDIYRGTSQGEEGGLSVSSITEGDISISFRKDVEESSIGNILSQYKTSLNRFRKVRFGS
jgi:Phage QLRG family, putative DNA packaging.